jgi:hypothetical protein
MQRRTFLVTMIAAAGLALPAVAAFSDDVVAQLVSQGYRDISVSKTWLGRIRIVATRDGGTREIVLNPGTGEILRDLWTASDGAAGSVSIVDDAGRDGGSGGEGLDHSSGSGSSGSGDGGASGSGGSSGSGDDDGEDDDNSGSGGGDDDGGASGSSGSGSGSSGSDRESDEGEDNEREDDRKR